MNSFMQHRIVTGCFSSRIGSANWSTSSSRKAHCKRAFPTAVPRPSLSFTGLILLILISTPLLLGSMQGQISHMKQPSLVPGRAACSVFSLSTYCIERGDTMDQPTQNLPTNWEDIQWFSVKLDKEQLFMKSQLAPVADPIYSTNQLLVGEDPECQLADQKPNKLVSTELPTECLATVADISAEEVEVGRNVSKITRDTIMEMKLVLKESLELLTTFCVSNAKDSVEPFWIQKGFQVWFR